MPKPTIADVALELVAADRAVTTVRVVEVVLERGLTRAKDPVRAVEGAIRDSYRFERLLDGRWTSLYVLLDGMTLTHELSEAEATGGALAVDADVGALWGLIERGPNRLLLDGATDLVRLFSEAATKRLGDRRHQRAIDGPPDWLPFDRGTFLHLRVMGRTVTIAPGPPPGPDRRIAERRLATIARDVLQQRVARRMDEVATIDEILAEALIDAPDLLREPMAPLGDVLREAGLEVLETLVGLPGTDWRGRGWIAWADLLDEDGADDDDDWDEDEETWSREEAVAFYRERFDLDSTEEVVLELLISAIDAEALDAPFEDPDLLRRFARMLDRPVMAEIVAAEAWRRPGVAAFAERALAGADPGTTAGVRTVLGTLADRDHDPDAAESQLHLALADDPAFPPALTALATLAEERGDLADALRLVKLAGVPSTAAGRAMLEQALAPATRKVGRNEPCPCGSGRKSKVCHPDGVGAVAPTGPRLLRWILGVWAARPDIDAAAHELMADAGFRPEHDVQEGSRDDTPDEDARWRMAHALAEDIVLFEDGELATLVEQRGHRLPADLRGLVQAWIDAPRTLLEVRAVEPGRGVTLHDLLDDRLLSIEDAPLARSLRPLDLVCTRPLPDGRGGYVVRGGFGVPRPQRAQLAAMIAGGDGMELLDWLWDPRPDLRVRTPEGDEVRFRSGVWVVPDADRARQRLAAVPGMRAEDADRYVLIDDPDGRGSVVGTIVFTGDEATLEAISDPRYARLVRALRAASSRVRVMRSSRKSPDQAIGELLRDGGSEDTGRPPIGVRANRPPELDAALDAFIQEHERRWVDESIPALGGLTPRQALDDPVARPKLDALLNDLQWDEREARARDGGRGAGVMQAGRIRDLLGIRGRTQA